MVLQKNTWVGSAILLATQLGSTDVWVEKELDRCSGYNSGSFSFIRSATGFIASGTTWDITNGSVYNDVYYRNAANYIVSGVTTELGKTISFTFFRDVNNNIVSGVQSVV